MLVIIVDVEVVEVDVKMVEVDVVTLVVIEEEVVVLVVVLVVEVIVVEVGVAALMVTVEVSVVVEVRVVVGSDEEAVDDEMSLLTAVLVELVVQVGGAARFRDRLLLLTGGTSHPLDSASLIPSYHAWAIREYPWSVGCNPSCKS